MLSIVKGAVAAKMSEGLAVAVQEIGGRGQGFQPEPEAVAAQTTGGGPLLVIIVAFILAIVATLFYFTIVRARRQTAAAALLSGEQDDRQAALNARLDALAQSQERVASRLDAVAENAKAVRDAVSGQVERRLDEISSTVAGQLETITGRLETRIGDAQSEIDVRLDAFSREMGNAVSAQTARTEAAQKALEERVALIATAQTGVNSLARDVGELRSLLSNKRAPGAIGEMQLKDIVRNAMPPSAYSFDARLSNGKRTDCLIGLPNPPGALAIDASFPVAKFQAVVDASSDEDLAQARREFRRAALKHLVDVAEHYIIPGQTADSALMFMASEAAFAELHAHHPDVIQDSYRARVWIVSPTTLMATLNTMRAMMRDADSRAEAEEVRKQAVYLLDDLSDLSARIAAFETRHSETREELDALRASRDNVARRAYAIEAKGRFRERGLKTDDTTTQDLLKRFELSAKAGAPNGETSNPASDNSE